MARDRTTPERSGDLVLPATATSPSRARAFVGEWLTAWGLADDVHDVLLAVSELVTNGLLHARTTMTLRVLRTGSDTVRLEVSDGSVAPPRGRRFTVESGTGRGLRLLDSIAEEWGVSTHDGGKTVWCVVRTGARDYAEFDVDAVEAL
ncbi:MAG TPA: ATP-binding protein [Frankiaceae bacterium]|nr:ATP-binding protein [Frankiaceae bacterium]